MSESKLYIDREGIKQRLNELGFRKVCENRESSLVTTIKNESLLVYMNNKPKEFILVHKIDRYTFKTINELNQIYEKLYSDINNQMSGAVDVY